MENNNVQNIVEIPLGELLPTAMGKREEGFRLAQVCCAFVDEKYELSYSFAKEYDIIHYRIVIERDTKVPSVTPIYKDAFLYENEMKELFGVNMEYIGVLGVIGADYKNKLYRIDEETPFIKEEP